MQMDSSDKKDASVQPQPSQTWLTTGIISSSLDRGLLITLPSAHSGIALELQFL